jgi:beta-glucanase (GH16 family)
MAWKRAFLFTLLGVLALSGSVLWVNLLQAADPSPTNVASAWDPITFDSGAVTYTLEAFGGAASAVVTDPTDAANNVAQFVKPAGAQTWAGVTVATEPGFTVPALPFTADDTTMTVRFWSPDAGTPVLLKVENASNGGQFVEVLVNSTVAGDWETLTFDFANPTGGALNLANTYNRVSIFPNFGNTGVEKTYYFDDVTFVEGTPPPPAWETITFDSNMITYTLEAFGGAASTVVVDPTDAANNVAQFVKPAGAQTWAGVTVATEPGFTVPTLPFTVDDTTMTVEFWSPDAGTPVLLKVENASNGGQFVEVLVNSTVAGNWETLTFDFANPTGGALNLAHTYNRVSIFPNFGNTGVEKTYYFDDVAFGGGTTPPPPPPPAWDTITFDSNAITYTLEAFGGAASTVVVDPTDAANNVAQFVKPAGAQTWAGVTVATEPGFTVPALPFTVDDTTMTVRFWSPDAGTPVLLKVENASNGGQFVEVLVNSTVAGDWETLTFDFANPTGGALNLAHTYNRVSIFPNFGNTGVENTYYFDDVAFGEATPPPPAWDTITFDSNDITYTLTGFGGADDSTVVVDPTDAGNNVARVVKSGTAELWAGTTVSTGPNFSVPELPFTANYTTMTVRVWSPDAGIQVRLKVEDAADGSKSVETEATTTVANDWETLTFDFANHASGTAPINLAYTYNKVSIFFNFGVTGGVAGEKIYYFDDVAFGDGGTTPPPTNPVVAFNQSQYMVVEGQVATITVALNGVFTETIMVDYATADNTAVAGTDYIATSGTLTFNPGDQTASFNVSTIDNSILDGNRSLNLVLSNPVSATLGFRSTASLLIQDNESPPTGGGKGDIIDDFENGLPYGEDGDGNGIGFVVWGDDWNGTTVNITTTLVSEGDPLALPGQGGDTHVLQFDANVNGWGGLTHAFENDTVDTWVPQDWTSYVGISFWIYGQNTGNDLLFEINENRNPGSTVADTEIWSHGFKDDFSGWKNITLNFDDDFTRKEIGNGAPNDGFTREQVHGWAFGSLATGGADVTYYLDDVALVVRTEMIDDFESGLPYGEDGDGNGIGFVVWGDDWNGTTVNITTTLVGEGDPLALPGQGGDTHVLQFDANVNGWGGFTHAFENETVDTWVPQNWTAFEGICFWIYGQNTGNDLLFEINENRNPGSTVADTEIWSHGFKDDFSGWRLMMLNFDDDFVRKEIGNGAPNDGFTREQVHGWAFGSLATGGADVTYYLDNVMVYGNSGSDIPVSVAFDLGKVSVDEGQTAQMTVELSREHDQPVTVFYTTAESNARPGQQYTPVSGTLTFPAGTLTQVISVPTHHDGKHTRDVRVTVNLYEGTGAPLGFQRRSVLTIKDIDPADPRLVDDFQGAHPFIYQDGNVELSITTLMDSEATAVPGQMAYEDVLTIEHDGASSFSRVFSQGQDWSDSQGLSFWFYGQNSGETITYELRDNMAATTAEVAPEDWVLVWSDEFDGPAGTPPNRNVWKHELGDGALNEIVGWGNSEFQYYSNSTENSSLDGNGNLVIRLQDTPADTDLVCWYGPCEYTSARLITQDQLDFEYGRIEARVQVPDGPGGLWPAFWMLGTNIPEVGWPQSGEIDIMEYVSRLPYEVFGTIHGPGYAGGASFGNTHTFTQTVPSMGYLTYGVEWTPDLIIWYVDDIRYHQAIPANVAPNEWVFNHPFFLLLNAAIGGNFGGSIDEGMTMPQDTLVDYVRVYQAADTAERFETTFVDDFTGWRKIELPFSDFVRSADQPAGAPNDGMGLTEVWGYGIILPESGSGVYHMDRVYLVDTSVTPPAPPVVTSVNDGDEVGTQPTFAGTAVPWATITVSTVTNGRNALNSLVCETFADVDGNWSCTPAQPLPLGEQTFRVVARNIAGDSTELLLTLTVTEPEPPSYTLFLPIISR